MLFSLVCCCIVLCRVSVWLLVFSLVVLVLVAVVSVCLFAIVVLMFWLFDSWLVLLGLVGWLLCFVVGFDLVACYLLVSFVLFVLLAGLLFG